MWVVLPQPEEGELTLVTNEFGKLTVRVQDVRQIADHFRRVYGTLFRLIKEFRKERNPHNISSWSWQHWNLHPFCPISPCPLLPTPNKEIPVPQI